MVCCYRNRAFSEFIPSDVTIEVMKILKRENKSDDVKKMRMTCDIVMRDRLRHISSPMLVEGDCLNDLYNVYIDNYTDDDIIRNNLNDKSFN